MQEFWVCFVPLFVAVDAIGTLPLFISLTEGFDSKRLMRVIIQSVITASVVTLGFLWGGPSFLLFLGITVSDFMIAGGILLLTISLTDLLTGEKKQKQTDIDNIGAVPIGVPLIAGPAVLTTCILLSSSHGVYLTAVSAFINILLAGIIFYFGLPICNCFGRTGTKTLSKLASLLLAAIAVMLIRKGILNIIHTTF